MELRSLLLTIAISNCFHFHIGRSLLVPTRATAMTSIPRELEVNTYIYVSPPHNHEEETSSRD